MNIQTCNHNNHRVNTNAVFKFDPTRTVVIRRKFEQDLVRRFKQIIKQITIALVENDIFELSKLEGIESPFNVNVAPPPAAFAFLTDSGKVTAFMEWLEREMAAGVLEIQIGTPVARAAQTAWTNTYIDSAYRRGVRAASSAMKSQGAIISDRFVDGAFNRPIHADAAGIIFTRTYEELNGITGATSTRLSQILSRGIIDGVGARELAKRLNEGIEAIGIRRSRVLARTEVIAAHAEAKLNTFSEAGVEGVTVQAEFSTAGDDLVCQECEALEGKVYTIDEARGIIPVHPNCRCTFLPVLENGRNVVL